MGQQQGSIQCTNLRNDCLLVGSQEINSHRRELLSYLLGGLVEHHLQVKLGESGNELLNLLLPHLVDLLVQLQHGLDLCHLSLLPQKSNQSVDVRVVVLDDLRVLEESLLLLGSAALALQKGS